MRVLVLGCGKIGSVIARDLAETAASTEITIADKHRREAKNVGAALSKENVSQIQIDVADYCRLVRIMKRFDLVVGALPGGVGYQAAKACIDAKVNMVDVSYMPQNPLELNADAVEAGLIIVPDCGVAPGLSNMLVGHSVSKLDQIESVHIMVGGLPQEPVPPLNYTITWSVDDLIDEYTRKVTIVENGKIVEVEALSGLESIEFPHVGKLEAFYTDGLRTLIHTLKVAKSMWEKTVRYPGHVEKIRLLKDLGLFDEESIEVEKLRVSPRKVTIKLLEKKLCRPEIKDVLAMKVETVGIKENSKRVYAYYLLDYYDEKHGIAAMARTTAYTASIVAQLLIQKVIRGKGVIPPESVVAEEEIFNKILAELKKRQIKIVASKSI